MSKKLKIDWPSIAGSFDQKRKLQLKPSQDVIYKCPVVYCDHEGFNTERGCRKHIHSRHGWYLYFDEKPDVPKALEKEIISQALVKNNKCRSREVPTLPKDSEFAKDFRKWLTSMTGGSRPENQANQIVSRSLKFLKAATNDDFSSTESTDSTVIDFYLGSGRNISDFIEKLQFNTGMGHSALIGYINALCDLIDYRKYQGVSSQILQNFSVVEMLMRKAQKCVSKKMRIQWNSQLDIDSLERKGHWATMENLQSVIPFHLEHYKSTLNTCHKFPSTVTSTDLTFTTRFVAVYLFLNVKGTRPMTYHRTK